MMHQPQNKKRKFTATELNHLLANEIDPDTLDIDEIGEIPVEYITNSAEFRGRVFFVDSSTLIPRIETEQIIDLGLKTLVVSKKKDGRITYRGRNKKVIFADIGTGSGVIGISFALELQKRGYKFKGILSDVSSGALQVCTKNSKKHFKKHKNVKVVTTGHKQKLNSSEIIILESDLFESFPQKIKFDVILANLPYVPTERITNLPESVKDYEPQGALNGGAGGIELIEKLLNQAQEFLKYQGRVILEVDDTHDREFIETQFGKANTILDCWEINILPDANGKVRFWVCRFRT